MFVQILLSASPIPGNLGVPLPVVGASAGSLTHLINDGSIVKGFPFLSDHGFRGHVTVVGQFILRVHAPPYLADRHIENVHIDQDHPAIEIDSSLRSAPQAIVDIRRLRTSKGHQIDFIHIDR